MTSTTLVTGVRMPGKAGRAYRAGENLARAGATTGTRTWEEFLATAVRTTVMTR